MPISKQHWIRTWTTVAFTSALLVASVAAVMAKTKGDDKPQLGTACASPKETKKRCIHAIRNLDELTAKQRKRLRKLLSSTDSELSQAALNALTPSATPKTSSLRHTDAPKTLLSPNAFWIKGGRVRFPYGIGGLQGNLGYANDGWGVQANLGLGPLFFPAGAQLLGAKLGRQFPFGALAVTANVGYVLDKGSGDGGSFLAIGSVMTLGNRSHGVSLGTKFSRSSLLPSLDPTEDDIKSTKTYLPAFVNFYSTISEWLRLNGEIWSMPQSGEPLDRLLLGGVGFQLRGDRFSVQVASFHPVCKGCSGLVGGKEFPIIPYLELSLQSSRPATKREREKLK